MNWYDYGFRNYDPQIGRFSQLDPLTFSYPFYTPYQYAGCEPIENVDRDGLEPVGSIVNVGTSFAKVTQGSQLGNIVLKSTRIISNTGGGLAKILNPALSITSIATNISSTANTIECIKSLNASSDNTTINRASQYLNNFSLKNIQRIPAEQANLTSGYTQPPYKTGTTVNQYRTINSQRFVRVFNDNTGSNANGSGPRGSWIMKESDIEGLNPKQIQDKYSLPNKPTFRVDVEVPDNTLIEQSIAGKNAFGEGGGLQYKLLEKIPSQNFTNFRFLPEDPLPPMCVETQIEEPTIFEEPSIVEEPTIFEEPIIP